VVARLKNTNNNNNHSGSMVAVTICATPLVVQTQNKHTNLNWCDLRYCKTYCKHNCYVVAVSMSATNQVLKFRTECMVRNVHCKIMHKLLLCGCCVLASLLLPPCPFQQDLQAYYQPTQGLGLQLNKCNLE
jgi:hypothetical protein